MPIPKHKCLPPPYCEPDEGIHCIADFFYPEGELADWQRSAKDSPFEVLKVQRDSDVNPTMQQPLNAWNNPSAKIVDGYVGYLIWLREKAPA